RGTEPAALPIGAWTDAGRAEATDYIEQAGAPRAESSTRRARRPRRSGAANEASRQRCIGCARRGRDAEGDRGRMSVLVLMEDGEPSEQTLTLARTWAESVHALRMDAITPFAPDAIAAILHRAVDDLKPAAVLPAGTDRGHDVMSRLAARAGVPFAANVI